MRSMHTVAEVLPPKGDEEMAKFNGARLTAWRSRASHALQVTISVKATACAKIEVKESVYPSEVEDADTLVLQLWDDGTTTPSRPWVSSYPKDPKGESPVYKHVVLLDGASKIIAVAGVQDVP
jgi:hypothetical protein